MLRIAPIHSIAPTTRNPHALWSDPKYPRGHPKHPRSCSHLGYRIVTTAGSFRTLISAPFTAVGTPSTAADRTGCESGDHTTIPPGGSLGVPRAEIHDDGVAARAHVVVERTVRGPQVRHAHTGVLPHPVVLDSSADHERAVALPLERQHVEEAPDVIAAHPGVRHVADELRRLRIPIDHFGPLVPCGRALALKKKSSSSCALSR